MRIKEIIGPLCLLGEGPVWNSRDESIYWLDILKNTIYKRNEASNKVVCVWKTDSNIGGIAFDENYDLLAFVKEGVKRIIFSKDGSVLFEDLIYNVQLDDDERYNDVIVDPIGRIFAGTMKSTKSDGKLFLFEKGKSPKVVLTGLGISNGMGFSPCKSYFYHIDSKTSEIKRYDYNVDTAMISNPKLIIKGDENQGAPDGMTVDSCGDLWIAYWGGCKVVNVDCNGVLIDEIHIDANQVSSVAFGGVNMKQLYVTTAGIGADDQKTFTNNDGTFMGGKLYQVTTETLGKADYYARI